MPENSNLERGMLEGVRGVCVRGKGIAGQLIGFQPELSTSD